MRLYLLITSFLNCAGTVLLGVSVLVASRRNPRNVLLSLLLFAVSVWSVFYCLWQLSSTPEWAFRFCRMLMVAAVFIPVTLSHFISRLTSTTRPLLVWIGYGLAVLLASGVLAGFVVDRVEWADPYGHWPKAGPLFPLILVYFAIWTGYSWWMAWKSARFADTPAARQLRYILAAVVIGFVGGATNFPLWFDIPIPPVGNGVILVYAAMLAHAIIKYRLPEVSIDLAKGMVYSCLALTLAVFYVVVYATAAYFVGAPPVSQDLLRQFVGGLAAIALFLWLAPRLKIETDRLMEHTLFKGRYRHRTQLRDLANRIFAIADEDRLFGEACTAIAGALQLEHAAIYFHKELQSGFVCRAALGYRPGQELPETLPEEHPLVGILQAERATIVYHREEVPSGPPSTELEGLRARFRFEALVPIVGHQTLLGVILLGHPRRDGFFDELDLSLVETIAVQIGLAVRSRQLERRANQTESLISLGTLAAGLAHELRNPLVSIKTFSGLLKEHGTDPEFQQGFLQVMDRDINRIGAIIESVAAFAESSQVEFVAVDLREVLRSVEEITAEERRAAAVDLVWPPDVPAVVRGNFGQLVQVFLNLVQNGVHALEGSERPRITVEWRTEQAGPGRSVRAEVSDNGCGIDSRAAPRIFDPFFTTKATGGNGSRRGMGLGLAIVKRIIDGHRGQIGVDSRLGAGTRFTILLPVPGTSAESPP